MAQLLDVIMTTGDYKLIFAFGFIVGFVFCSFFTLTDYLMQIILSHIRKRSDKS